MRIFMTADPHFGHKNVIEYCSRPFKNVDHMNESLIRNWNQRVKLDDVTYVVGDFCFLGGSQGGLTKAQEWESRLNGKVIYIAGNHDSHNKIKGLRDARMLFAGSLIYMVHEPPERLDGFNPIPDLIICGHVHQHWRTKLIKNDPNPTGNPMLAGAKHEERLIVNVGVDVWDYRPVLLQEVITFAQKVMRESGHAH